MPGLGGRLASVPQLAVRVDDDDGCEVRRLSRLDVSGLGVKHVCRASSSWSRSTTWIHKRRRSRGIDLFERLLTGS